MARAKNQRIDVNANAEPEINFPIPYGAEKLVDLLIGRDAPPTCHLSVPVRAWPSYLVAAIARVSAQTPGLTSCSWKLETATETVRGLHEIRIHCGPHDHLPDKSDADLFGVLAGYTCQHARRVVEGKQENGYLWMSDVLIDLNLDSQDTEMRKQVIQSIARLFQLSVLVSSRFAPIQVRPRKRGQQYNVADDGYEDLTMFCMLASFEAPSSMDNYAGPIRLSWSGDVQKAFTKCALAKSEPQVPLDDGPLTL